MPIVYLDHNVVVGLGGVPKWRDAEDQLVRLQQLSADDVRFAMSAWHAVELAQSKDAENVQTYCDFVDCLDPLWANNPNQVKREELSQYLASLGGTRSPAIPVRPFSPTIPQMWASYSGVVFLDDTFRGYVTHLQRTPADLKAVTDAADQTAPAIATGRSAYKDGRWKEAQPLIDAEFFRGLLGGEPGDQNLNAIMENVADVHRACPAIAVEEQLTSLRVRDGFNPKRSHAADLQHALVGLAYADVFVTDDKNLCQHCEIVVRKLASRTRVVRNLLEV